MAQGTGIEPVLFPVNSRALVALTAHPDRTLSVELTVNEWTLILIVKGPLCVLGPGLFLPLLVELVAQTPWAGIVPARWVERFGPTVWLPMLFTVFHGLVQRHGSLLVEAEGFAPPYPANKAGVLLLYDASEWQPRMDSNHGRLGQNQESCR